MSSPTNSLIPPNAQAQIDRAKSMVTGMSRPAKILGTSFVVVALAIGGYFGTRTMFEPYTTLFTSLERDDTAQIVAKLKELKIPFRLGSDGTTIEVPEARAHELRLDLASAGLPRGGNVGFESFDKMRLGATDFEQRVLFRRSLEGELSRTIGSIAAVQSARVHLVMPEKSVFVSKSEPATASIVLKLRGGRTLGANEISGIVHLSATSVPGLSPDHVTVVSTEGAVLHRPRRGGDRATDLDENDQTPARALENSLEERTKAMLERIVGVGKADVRISAEMDMARVERVEDHFDPSKTALRSEERTIERASGSGETLAGVPGAESALPTGSAPAGSAAPTSPGTIRESHTRNFEVDHVLEKRTATTGSLKRLTVAVVLDGATKIVDGKPVTVTRSAEELEMLTKLVRSAVGADEKRGDLIAVQSVNFADVTAGATIETPAVTSLLAKFDPKKHGKYVGIAGAGLVALMVVGIILRRRAAARRPLEPIMIGELANATTAVAGLNAAAPSAAALARAVDVAVDSRDEATDRALRDPASAALVLRAWLGVAEEKDPKAA